MAKLMMATIRIRGNPGPTGRSRRCSAGQPRYEFGGGAQGSCMVTPLMRHQDTTTSWMSAPAGAAATSDLASSLSGFAGSRLIPGKILSCSLPAREHPFTLWSRD